MSYATVMVHLDVSGEMGLQVKVAAALADRFRARLIGISGWAPTSVFLAEEALQDPILSTPPLQEMKSILDIKGRQFEAAFHTDSRPVEWRSGLDFPSDYIAREARAADLLVIGRQFRSEDLFRSLDPGELIESWATSPIGPERGDLILRKTNCNCLERYSGGSARGC